MLVKQGWRLILILCGGVWLAGCSSSSSPEQSTAESSDASAGSTDDGLAPPVASIGMGDDDEDDDEPDDGDDTAAAEPEEGSAEWHVREIVRLRLKPFPPLDNGEQGDAETDEEPTEAAAREKAAKELAHQAAVGRERNLAVIKLAKQAIGLTNKDPKKEMVFNVAVHHLLDARLQLALAGEQEDVDALYDIAEVLQQSRPDSEIAAAAQLTIVNFAHANAVRYAQTEPKWIQEFARQAQLFANRLADSLEGLSEEEKQDKRRAVQTEGDVSRAAQILLVAGQSCEAANLSDDAKACYLLLKSKFPETLPAAQAAGIIRRLNLRGQPLQLAGPTLDGQFLSIEEFKGKTVLVVFWSSQAKPFVDQLPALTEFLKKAPKGVAVVSVNLDNDELEVADFIEGRGLTWPTIFHSEPEKRGWNAPAASYYGIMNVPTFWIVDAGGNVAETEITAENVKSKLAQVYKQDQQRAKTGDKGAIRQTKSSSDDSVK